MSRMRIIQVVAAILLLGPTTAQSGELGDAASLQLQTLAVELGTAANEGFRTCRLRGKSNAGLRDLHLQRLRTQARVLRASVKEGRRSEEIRPVVLAVQALARDLAQEATDGFASVHFEEIVLRVQTTADELGAVLAEPQRAVQRIALEHHARPGR